MYMSKKISFYTFGTAWHISNYLYSCILRYINKYTYRIRRNKRTVRLKKYFKLKKQKQNLILISAHLQQFFPNNFAVTVPYSA